MTIRQTVSLQADLALISGLMTFTKYLILKTEDIDPNFNSNLDDFVLKFLFSV